MTQTRVTGETVTGETRRYEAGPHQSTGPHQAFHGGRRAGGDRGDGSRPGCGRGRHRFRRGSVGSGTGARPGTRERVPGAGIRGRPRFDVGEVDAEGVESDSAETRTSRVIASAQAVTRRRGSPKSVLSRHSSARPASIGPAPREHWRTARTRRPAPPWVNAPSSKCPRSWATSAPCLSGYGSSTSRPDGDFPGFRRAGPLRNCSPKSVDSLDHRVTGMCGYCIRRTFRDGVSAFRYGFIRRPSRVSLAAISVVQ